MLKKDSNPYLWFLVDKKWGQSSIKWFSSSLYKSMNRENSRHEESEWAVYEEISYKKSNHRKSVG